MANLTITNNDLGSVIFKYPVISDDVLTLSGVDDVEEGRILARDSVSGKLVDYVVGGVVNENGIPKAVIPYAFSGAAGDNVVRVITAGWVILERLSTEAGDTITKAIQDQLRNYAIVPVSVNELSELDNQ